MEPLLISARENRAGVHYVALPASGQQAICIFRAKEIHGGEEEQERPQHAGAFINSVHEFSYRLSK